MRLAAETPSAFSLPSLISCWDAGISSKASGTWPAMAEREDTAVAEDGAAETEAESGRLAEALAARRDKVDRLRARGVEPFALGFDPTTTLAEIRDEFGALGPDATTGRTVRVAGADLQQQAQEELGKQAGTDD